MIQLPFSGPVEKCGVTAVYRTNADSVEWIESANFEQRHRGHESWGVSTYSDRIMIRKYRGMVPEDNDQLPEDHDILGNFGIGHVRYGTAGSSGMPDAQPIEIDAPYGRFAIAHNGTICNARKIKARLEDKGVTFRTSTDTELVGLIIAEGDGVIDGYRRASCEMMGSWCLTVVDKDGIYAMRDPHGFKPLVLGSKNGDYMITSEPGVFKVLGLDFLRDITPGEIIHIDSRGDMHGDAIESKNPAYCAFERVYFARPDSVIDTTPIGQVRLRLGANLSEIETVHADFIQGVPDSGSLYAQGYHSKTGAKMGTVIMRKRHWRTFIRPGEKLSKIKSKYFLLPFRSMQSGMFFEDSIVRGNTMKGLIEWLRGEGGLREVHIRVGSPPFRRPCPYGIDMQTNAEFVINNHAGVEGVRRFINADTLIYLDEDSFFDGLGISGIPREDWCTACWGIGDYPTEVPAEYSRF